MRIAVSGNYTIPTTLSKVAIKEGLFIDVDTTGGAVQVTLPPVGTYPFNQKIFIVDDGGNAGTNAITVKADATPGSENHIEGEESATIDNDNDSLLFIASKGNGWNTKEHSLVDGSLRPYKTFVVRLGQVGTNAPTFDVEFEKSIQWTPSTGRSGVGNYSITSSSFNMPADKTYVALTNVQPGIITNAWIAGSGDLQIRTIDHTGAPSDDVLNGAHLEIRVYP